MQDAISSQISLCVNFCDIMASWDLFVTNCKILQWRKINWPFLYLEFEILMIPFLKLNSRGFFCFFFVFFCFVQSRVLESLIGSVRPRSPSFFWSFPKKVQPTWWRWASHRLEGVVWKCTTDVPELQFLICEAFKSLLGFPALGKKIYLYLLHTSTRGMEIGVGLQSF